MKLWWIFFGMLPVMETAYLHDCGTHCTCDLYIADCRRASLSEIPNDINRNVTSLDVSHNSFKNVPRSLKEFKNLKYLNLSNNMISTCGHMDFEGLTNLERLDLSFNQFHDWKDIHSQALAPLKKLRFLDFSNNPVRSVPQYSSHLLINSLEILKMQNCSMVTFPVTLLSQLNNLRELHLSKNPIQSITGNMRSTSLKYIDLSSCRTEYIAESVFQELEVLETLVMRNNKYLRNLTINSDSLLYIDLSGSNLGVIPLGNLRAVTVLDMYENFLKALIGNSFKNYFNLNTLNLSTNAISYIANNSFRGLDNLQILDLSYNKLTSLSEKVLLPTTSLITLNLSHNYLNTIDTLTSSSLQELDASYCEIYEVSRYSLINLPKLTKLSLARNYISTLPDSWTGDRLYILVLSNCRIKSINNRTFEQMSHLNRIDLSGNRLTSVDPSNFATVTYVRLNDNQWTCNCSKIKSMFEWMWEAGRPTNELICDAPERYEGLTWEMACWNEWYPAASKPKTLWWYSIVTVVGMVILVVLIVAMKRINSMREERIRELEEQRRTQEREAREALQRMQRAQREFVEEADRNAPDPRELERPPSYTEALLLPTLNASHLSLNGSLHSIASRPSLHGSNPEINRKNKPRRKRRRRKTDESRESRRQSRASVDETESEPDRIVPPLESDF